MIHPFLNSYIYSSLFLLNSISPPIRDHPRPSVTIRAHPWSPLPGMQPYSFGRVTRTVVPASSLVVTLISPSWTRAIRRAT